MSHRRAWPFAAGAGKRLDSMTAIRNINATATTARTVRPIRTSIHQFDTAAGRIFRHIEGIAAYCDHPVHFGVVESINTTIKAVLRRARGMRDEQMLLLKLKWTTARPIRSARDLARFLSPQGLYSNR